MKPIPSFLYKLYSKASLRVKAYARLRWRFCPFAEIESFAPKKARVIDMGCGFGLLANYLALTSEDRDVLGIDLSEERIASALDTIGDRKNINFIRADIKNVNIADCDIVVMTDFLHHISFERQEALLKDIFMRLKSGGRLILQDIDSSCSWRYFFTRGLDQSLNIGKPLFYRDKNSWEKLLRMPDFDIKVFHRNVFFLSDILFICDKKEG